MKSDIILSIIIPVYNTGKYLKRCISSIQLDNSNIELILVNDGSTDNSLDICKTFLKYRNVNLITSSNEGLSSARNKGLKIANGNYITFLDSDDYVSEDYISVILNSIKKNDFDIAVFGYYVNFEEKKKFPKSPPFLKEKNNLSSEYIHNLYKSSVFNLAWNKVYKKSLILSNEIEFEKNSMPCEDFIFNCIYFKYVKKLFVIEMPLYNYMKQGNENTLVSKYYPNLLNTVIMAINGYNELLNTFPGNNNEYKKYLSYKYLFSCIPNVFKGSENPKKDFEEILLEMKRNDVFSLKISNDINFKILKVINRLPNSASYIIYVTIVHLYWKMKGKEKK